MKDWLLIYTGMDRLHDLARAELLVFRSGDDDRPEPGDFQAAVAELCARHDTLRLDRLDAEPVGLVLVPLDGAQLLEARRGFTIATLGEYEPPLAVDA